MRIVLTHGYFLNDDEKERLVMRPYPPLGLLYLSAFLTQYGYENEVHDTTFSTFQELQADLDHDPPHILGIYTNLMTKLNVLKLLQYVKNSKKFKKTKIILGGPEVRFHAQEFLHSGADVVVLGEGEETLLELVRHYQSPNADVPWGIAGVAFKSQQGETIMGPARELISNLDVLPMPARHKINLHQYFETWREKHGYASLSISTMRGCPYSCKWCSRAVYGKTYRRRSPRLVVQEILDAYEKYNFDRIWFVDDVFTINHGWLREFAAAIDAAGLRIPYEAISRADRMNEEVIIALKKSGCFRIWIGAESGSQSILDSMHRMVKVDKVIQMVKLCKQHGIETGNFIMLGYPGEQESDILQTLQFLKNANPDHYTITVAYPIKGTPMYEEVEPHILGHLDWQRSTDRDIEFRRNYNRQYYDHAVNWINREMEAHKAGIKGHLFLANFKKLRALRQRLGMWRQKTFFPASGK